uniref:Hexosyltransferase n=1 Tax=Cacopsylla melanoneura TaxID=428564 RepID=A0A8D8TS28_9HEMI
MALIKSKSTLEVIRYIPSKKIRTNSKLQVILKRSKQKTRVCNVLAGLCMGLYLGVLLRPKLLTLFLPKPSASFSSDSTSILTSPSGGVPAHEVHHDPLSSRMAGDAFHGSVTGTLGRSFDQEKAYRIVNISGPPNIEGSADSLLFVGVMTANAYLATRAAAVYETWAKDVPGRVAFFSSEISRLPPNQPDLPLIKLRGVDDSYPPQKKSFMMLQYMWEHYGDRFEWFMRADDDVYVRTDKLEGVLRSVDSSKPQFIGQAGRGNQEEFGLLSLEYDENFCMGGPGIILSRATLALVAPHIKYCLKNLYTTHEDVELGRCVQKFAGIPCTWSYEMQNILYHNSSGRDAFTGNLKVKEVHRAMTLHPVKRHKHMYRIHNYMRGLKIHEISQETLFKHRDIYTMLHLLGGGSNSTSHGKLELLWNARELSQSELTHRDLTHFGLALNVPLFDKGLGEEGYLGDPFSLGKKPGLLKSSLSLSPWTFMSRTVSAPGNLNPRKKLESHIKEGLDDVIREVMENLNKFSRERGRMIEYKELLYGYYRENPQYGIDYILDLLLVYKKYRGRKMTVPVRKHTYVQQQFTDLQIRELVPDISSYEYKPPPSHDETDPRDDKSGLYPDEDILLSVNPAAWSGGRQHRIPAPVLINFILGLSGRFETFQRFIDNFERVCLKADGHVKLYIVLFPPNTLDNTAPASDTGQSGNSVNRTMRQVNALNAKYARKISVLPVFDTFSRAKALQIGASQVRPPNDLLFFVDVDILFTSDALERIRAHTLRMRQVYFPIVFSQYDPALVYSRETAPDHFRISEEAGYWRTFGYGIAACYKSDFDKVGGFDSSISGWGKEDVDLFDKFVRGGAAPSEPDNPPSIGPGPQTTPVRIFRAPDPHLIHVYHDAQCDARSAQYTMCVNSRAQSLASQQVLGDFVARNKDYFGRREKLIPEDFR